MMKKSYSRLVFCFLFVMSISTFSVEGSSLYAKDRALVEEGKKQKSIELLSNFITSRPDSVWVDNAVYYRDKYALDKAKRVGTVEALNTFLKKYPDSVWGDNGVAHRDNLALRIARKKGTVEAFDEFIGLYPDSAGKDWAVEAREKAMARKKRLEKTQKSMSLLERSNQWSIDKSRVDPSLPEHRQRVERALLMFEEKHKEERVATAKQAKVEQLKQKRKQRCQYMKDRVRMYAERRIWYRLDNDGQRVYLTDQEVNKSKADLKLKYEEKCS